MGLEVTRINIPVEIEKKIEEISEEMGIDKEDVVIEALREFLEEYQDYEEAYKRYKDSNDKLITIEEMRDSLGI